MKNDFLAKAPIFLGMVVSGATCLLLVLFLVSGDYSVTPRKTEVYLQQPVKPVSSAVNWESSEKNLCYRSAGRWMEFADGCADICGAGPECTQVLKMSCDCGQDRCWDTESFVCQPSR